MKISLFILGFLIALYLIELSRKANEYHQRNEWVKCLENSEGSDAECYRCDELFNKSGKFSLIKQTKL